MEDAGFEAEEIKEVEESSVRLLIEGMTLRVHGGGQRALTEMSGVEAVLAVSLLPEGSAEVRFSLISLGCATSSRS